jgi:hypothetical protein
LRNPNSRQKTKEYTTNESKANQKAGDMHTPNPTNRIYAIFGRLKTTPDTAREGNPKKWAVKKHRRYCAGDIQRVRGGGGLPPPFLIVFRVRGGGAPDRLVVGWWSGRGVVFEFLKCGALVRPTR